MNATTQEITTAEAAPLPVVYNWTPETIAAELRGLELSNFETPRGYELGVKALTKCKRLRGSIEAKRKELKAGALEYGRRVDEVAKTLAAAVETVEGPLKAARAAVDAERERLEREAAEAARREEEERQAAERKAQEEAARVERERLAAEREEFNRQQAEREAAVRAEAERQRAERAQLDAERAELDRQRAELEAENPHSEEAQREAECQQEDVDAKAPGAPTAAQDLLTLEIPRVDPERLARAEAWAMQAGCPLVLAMRERGAIHVLSGKGIADALDLLYGRTVATLEGGL